MSSADYSDEHIQLLTAPEDIRRRPGMFIGDTQQSGFNYLVRGPLINATDEVRAGFGDWVGFTLGADGSCAVEDNGRGMLVQSEPGDSVPIAEKEMTVVRGGKCRKSQPYRQFTGLFGLGATLTALSEWCVVETIVNHNCFQFDTERGLTTSPLRELGPAVRSSGLKFRFKPDPDIFGDHTFDLRAILHTLCELAFLHSGVRFTFTDDRTGCTDTFHFADGLTAFVKHLNTGRETLHEPIRISGKEGGIVVEVAFQYRKDCELIERGYANCRFAPHGGTHIHGFHRGLGKTIREFAERHGCWRQGLKVFAEDIRDGLTAVVSIEHPEPLWVGAIASSLGNSDAEKVVSRVVHIGLSQQLESDPEVGKKLCKQIEYAATAREAVRRACGGQRVSQSPAG